MIVQLYLFTRSHDVVLCVDTSVVMAVILNEPTKRRLLTLTHGADLLSAPSLPWEVGNALTALFRRGRIDLRQARQALGSLARIPVRLGEVEVDAAVEMAHEFGIYAYDAYVLECARRYRAPLLSLDQPQCDVARQLGVEVMEV